MTNILDFTLEGNSELTMSTVELAELTNKRHDNVMQVARQLKEKGVIGTPEIQECYNNNNLRKIFKLNKIECLNLVARLSPKFMAGVIARWLELEKEKATTGFQIPDSLPDALRLAAEQCERADIAEEKLAVIQPKIAALTTAASDLLNFEKNPLGRGEVSLVEQNQDFTTFTENSVKGRPSKEYHLAQQSEIPEKISWRLGPKLYRWFKAWLKDNGYGLHTFCNQHDFAPSTVSDALLGKSRGPISRHTVREIKKIVAGAA